MKPSQRRPSQRRPSQRRPSPPTKLRRPASRVRYVAAALAAVAVIALAGCGSSPPPPFNPSGQTSAAAVTPLAQQTGPAGVTMPSFGKNARVVMTSWRPKDASLAQAVLTDKDYKLAYLYAEYTGGQSEDWTSYVNAAMQTEISGVLAGPDVTTESFKGTIRIFDMTASHDPVIPADVDVSACFDNAQAVNTSLSSGAVLPGQAPSDSNYYRYTDELAPTSSGQWQVVAAYQNIYYPQAKECKP
jgi:hypothetical protein